MLENVENERERIRIISLLIDVCDLDMAIERIKKLIGNGGFVACANVHMTMEANDDTKFASIVNSADLIVADGKPIAVMQRKLGKRNAKQIRGFDLMTNLLEFAAENNIKVGIYGGEEKTLEAFKKRAATDFPGIDIAYSFSPPYIAGEMPLARQTVSDINDARVSLLFVALGCPKQEKWMAQSRESLSAVQIGVGAAVDFYAGTAVEAPKFLQRIGLEWLFRLFNEPKRLWRRYLLNNPRFVYRAVRQLLSKVQKNSAR
jgi:N-acetylglucosaminyldiphosphoundecaprenol N-acetyl-beta-D-mannosaminyltransferase